MSGNAVKKGTTIFTAKPFAFVLHSEFRTIRCDNCLKKGKLSRCSNCQYVYYCNRNCQKKSWPIHKAECACLKKFSPNYGLVPHMVRLMARVIFKLNHGGADEMGYYTKNNFRKFKDLMSHTSDIKADGKRLADFLFLFQILLSFLEEIPVLNEELIDIYGKICTNTFGIHDDNMYIIASGLYLGASIIDHSCRPNVIAIFEGTTIIIRTLTDLPSLDWSQIRLTYIDILDSKKERRKELYNSYYFRCDCERCKEEEPMAEAAACLNSSCDSPCSIQADECKKCGAKISAEFKKTFRNVSDFTATRLEVMFHLNDWKKLCLSQICLKKQEGVMHKLNVLHVRTLQMAHAATMNLRLFEAAELYTKKLVSGYLLYYGEIHPMTGSLYLSIGEMKLSLKKPKEALQALVKAGEVLRITHGCEHSLMKKLSYLCCHAAILSSIIYD